MKVAVVGATGRAGSEIVGELARRGHEVLAIARKPGEAAERVTPLALDAADSAALSEALRGQDAVVTARRFADTDAAAMIGAVTASGVPRLLVVGGAASLRTADGKRLFDSAHFPEAYRAEAGAGIAFLDLLKASEGLDWTFLSPSMLFDTGPRTGGYRSGKDDLLHDAEGISFISFADYAIAMADEIESPKHSRERFTVGY
ncbi:NAD(P)-dependent oxidoreductase [Sphingomonas immobilis]|uniref:NAD(P)H-binding protein n=1 Tax=Sphingomonas immobilis TaxID=3063997 RepID=A0ABT8ZYS4_9SPHN|nr:NAD(P)H-binding protein [Sphingomonas sp. CA1-15]MDO7842729.1 NAD(P)H-binding protein [Sphingomonas sp. CA1-15]